MRVLGIQNMSTKLQTSLHLSLELTENRNFRRGENLCKEKATIYSKPRWHYMPHGAGKLPSAAGFNIFAFGKKWKYIEKTVKKGFDSLKNLI